MTHAHSFPETVSPPPQTGVGGRRTASILVRGSKASGQSILVLIGMAGYLFAIHSAKPIGAGAILLALIGLVFDRGTVRVPKPLWWFAAFIAWAALGYAQAERPQLAGIALLGYVKLWLIFLVAINVARSRFEWERLAVAWLAIFALYPVRGTVLNIAQGITEQGRYAWNFIFSNPNDLATLTLPILALSLAMAQSLPRGWLRRASVAGSIILPALIFATQSRGGILALGTFFLLAFTYHRKRLQAAALVACTVGAIALAAPRSVWNRLAGLKEITSSGELSAADQYGSADQRFEIWRVGRAIIADNPLLGVGVGGYNKVHAEYASGSRFRATARGERDTHSLYLHAAAETGIPGLLLLMGVILSVAAGAWQALRRTGISPADAMRIRTLLFGLVAFLQASLFATMEHLPFLYLYLALIYSAVESSKDRAVAPGISPAPVPAPARTQRPAPPRRYGRRS